MILEPEPKEGLAGIAGIFHGGHVVCRPPVKEFDSLAAVSCPYCGDPWERYRPGATEPWRPMTDPDAWLKLGNDIVLTCGRCRKTFGMNKKDGKYRVAEAVS